jgi:hypothetical protein
MKELLFGNNSVVPLGITVALIVTAWLSFLSVVIFA